MATRQQPPRPPAAALRRRRRRAYVFLLPLLLVVVLVLLCPAGRVHAALASAEGEKRDGGNQKQHPEQQDRDLGGETGEEDRQNDSSSSSSSTSGDAEAGAGGGQRPTFTALHGRSRAELEGEGYQCFPTGECIECTEEEMAQPYCKATQLREEVTCEREETVRTGVESQKKVRAVTTYETCYATAGDDMTSMLRFQAVMAVLGGLALYGVRSQKLKHQTLYERRQTTRSRQRGPYSGI